MTAIDLGHVASVLVSGEPIIIPAGTNVLDAMRLVWERYGLNVEAEKAAPADRLTSPV